MKVSELEGAELDYWVAKAEGFEGPCNAWVQSNMGSAGGAVLMKNDNACSHKKCYASQTIETIHGVIGGCPEFSTNWLHGGPIIEKKKLALYPTVDGKWDSHIGCYGRWLCFQPTPLIAAMRVYVRSEFGDTVEDI